MPHRAGRRAPALAAPVRPNVLSACCGKWDAPDRDRARARAALISILCGLPQPDPAAPGALASGIEIEIPGSYAPAQSICALHYQQLPEHLRMAELRQAGGSIHGTVNWPERGSSDRGTTEALAVELTRSGRLPLPRSAVPHLKRKPSAGPRREASSTAMSVPERNGGPFDAETARQRFISSEGREHQSVRRREGDGGRKPPAVFSSDAAGARLFARWGQPDETRRLTIDGRLTPSRTYVWSDFDRTGRLQLDPPDFDLSKAPAVAMLARLSSRELQGGETLGGQVMDGLLECQSSKLHVAMIIASEHLSGDEKMEARMASDLGLVIEAVEDKRICGLVARDAKRVARRITTATQFSECMAEMGARMWLSDMRREVDWDNDFLLLLIKQAEAHTDHRELVEKMLKARRRGWLEEGRGWPGLKRFGLRRNHRTKFLEWDPAQWPVIKFIHYEYSRLEGDPRKGKSGYVRLSQSLAAEPSNGGWGIDLSPEKIRQILRDPIYVDGSYVVLYNKSHLVACRPAEIPVEERIPLDLFQQNQELLATRKGPNRRNPVGTFLLNGINVVCATCEQLTNDKYPGKHPRLKGRQQPRTAAAYYVVPFRGDCCHRFTLPKLVLEEAVVRALWQLADDEKLQADWAARALPGVGAAPPIFSEGQADAMRREIANLEQRRHELVAEQSRQAAAGEAPSTAVTAIIDQMSVDLDTRRNRLQHAARQDELRSRHDAGLLDRRRRRTLSKALREVLTIEMPEDLRARVRRAAVVEACLSKVVLHRTATGLKLELFGPLVPKALLDAGTKHDHLPVSPLNAARSILEGHLRQQETSAASTSTPEIAERVTAKADHQVAQEEGEAAERAETGVAGGAQRISTSSQVQTWQEVQTWDWSEVSGAVIREEMPAVARDRRPSAIKDPVPSFRSPLVAVDLWRAPETRFPQWQVEAVQAVSRALDNRVLSLVDYSFYRDLHPELHLPRAEKVKEIIDAGTYLALGVVPTALRSPRRRSADFPLERCIEAIRLARERLPQELPLSAARYRALSRLHDDLPSHQCVVNRVREHGLTFSQLRAVALGRDSDGGKTKTMSRGEYEARLQLTLSNGGRAAAESRRRQVRSEFVVRRSIPDKELERRLRELVGGRDTMPSHAEFLAAGEEALYTSMILYGGIVLWAERLDLMYFGRAGGEAGRRYVEQSIERALRDFCGDRADWPGTQAFKRAGLRWLYRLVCKRGGSRLWAERLGLTYRVQRSAAPNSG